jgi:ribokinase
LYRSSVADHHQPAAPARVVDTTGAGDAFSAALAVALADDESLEEAVRWGAAAGAVATEAVGAQAGLPDRSALMARLALLEAGPG